MTASTYSIRLAVAAGYLLLAVVVDANAQSPQISEGVRAMMFVDKGVKFGPDDSRYMLGRQPPVYDYMKPGTTHFFKADSELIHFFETLPQSVQGRGLWITKAVPPDGETDNDRDRVAQLIKEASSKNLLLYVCNPMPDDKEIIGWGCTKQSPQRSPELISCAPRAKPHLGHPWWDCSIRATK